MTSLSCTKYPGDSVTAEEILRLAEEYKKAAELLRTLSRRGSPISRAPFRLSAIHAIELYLNALLLHSNRKASEIRKLQHNLEQRLKLAAADGLQLRKKTMNSLVKMTADREYLVTRYDPEFTASVSQINRVEATLDKVAREVTKIVGSSN